MYIRAEFNKKRYLLGKILHKEMASELIRVYSKHCTDVKYFLVVDNLPLINDYSSQSEFIKDYKKFHHLVMHIEQLPLDKP